MKILHLTLKKQWFEMVAANIKKEEYREIKPYWNKRLSHKKYDAVLFKNGYGNVPLVLIELKEILTGYGILEWGAPPGETVYILKLGIIIKRTDKLQKEEHE